MLEAPPGAGKTTLVPLALLDEPWLEGKRILMLEPRRLATRAAARRMAQMLGENAGETVGFRTRLETRVGSRTRIEVMTEGILPRLIEDDPGLDGVGLVIFDEFHERSLEADLGLALALDSRRHLRGDLRLLVMSATIDGARVPIQVDVGFGDAVTPEPVEIDYPTLLDAPAPHLRAYPVETVVAEKFEALVTLGMANSRLKDFYDLWLIAQTFELRQSTLADAVRRTFERRRTALVADTPVGLTDEFAATWNAQWRAFLDRERMAAAPDAFAAVIADLRAFLMPLVHASEDGPIWPPGGPWSLGASGGG